MTIFLLTVILLSSLFWEIVGGRFLVVSIEVRFRDLDVFGHVNNAVIFNIWKRLRYVILLI